MGADALEGLKDMIVARCNCIAVHNIFEATSLGQLMHRCAQSHPSQHMLSDALCTGAYTAFPHDICSMMQAEMNILYMW